MDVLGIEPQDFWAQYSKGLSQVGDVKSCVLTAAQTISRDCIAISQFSNNINILSHRLSYFFENVLF